MGKISLSNIESDSQVSVNTMYVVTSTIDKRLIDNLCTKLLELHKQKLNEVCICSQSLWRQGGCTVQVEDCMVIEEGKRNWNHYEA